MSLAPCFTQTDILMFHISYLADSRQALAADTPYLTRWQSDQGVLTLLYHQLGGCPGTPYHLPTSASLQFNIVYLSARRD